MRLFYLSVGNHIHDLRFLYKFVEKKYEVHAITFTEICHEIKGIEYHTLPFPELFFRSPRKLRKTKLELLKLIDKYKPDIIHATWIPTYGFLAAYANRHPLLLTPWGSDILLKPYDFYNLKESWMSPLNKVCTQFALKRADMIQCDAESVKKRILEIQKIPEEKIKVFPQLGIDLSKFNSGNKNSTILSELGLENKKILVMTRNLEPVYGIEYFLEAIAKIVNKTDCRVIMCGDGSLRKELVSFIKRKKIEKYVHFIGHVKNEELPHYLNASHIYVSTSLSDGTSLSLLEAMACGLPVVVTDVPANLEWIRDGYNGFVSPRKDSEVLAKKIIELLKNKKLRETFGRRNLEIAKKKADINKNFERFEEIYQGLLKSKIF